MQAAGFVSCTACILQKSLYDSIYFTCSTIPLPVERPEQFIAPGLLSL